MKPTPQYPLVKLPTKLDQIFFLIREELKSQKYFNTLNELGHTDNFYQPHLGKLILLLMDLDDGTDEIFQFYYAVVEKRSKKIGMDNKSVMKQVMKVYGELEGRRKAVRSS
jgi:hypothetical protein